MKIKMLLIGIFGLSLCGTLMAAPIQITPQPLKVEQGAGTISLAEGVAINAKGFNARYLSELMSDECAIKVSKGAKVKITLSIDESLSSALTQEGYRLTAKDSKIEIVAPSDKGIYYGIQSLRQMVNDADKSIPEAFIEDKPRFSWRAFMFDDARYFHGVDMVKHMIDEMSALKMNVLHWHLTDDQGWRIEIKKYPDLTRIGAFRDSTEIGGYGSGKYDGKPHGGFYTQKEIREVIAYAADRGVSVVPEIEMPGHATAAIAAYPWLGTTKEQIKVTPDFGKLIWVYNVADPKVYSFLEDVIREVATLFPSQVIHIGGDEVAYDHWRISPEVKTLMEREGMKNMNEVQVNFTNRIARFIDSIDRRMMGWNEIMGKNVHEWSQEENASPGNSLSKNAIVHFWKGDPEFMKEAIMQGNDVVNSTHNYTYLDYSLQTLPLKTAYEFNPVPEGLTSEQQKRVLGSGCQLWCEWLPDLASVHRQVFPRIAAYAEVGWSQQENKDYDRFLTALEKMKKDWSDRGIKVN